MDSHSLETSPLTRGGKMPQLPLESREEPVQRRHNRQQEKVLNIEELPPLFRCKSYIEVRNVINTGKGAVADIFRGYNPLHWYCNAKSTCPKIIQQLLQSGIDINAVDQRPHNRNGPVIRHTALGYACRNANVKAVHTLLRNGADPSGLAKLDLPKKDTDGNEVVYPSPLQELLCQPVHGPRLGKCPWTYHLNDEDEEKDGYLDEEDPERLPEFRRIAAGPSENTPLCELCADNYHIWDPWPENEEERLAARERRQSCYYGQLIRLGNRLKTCVQLLLNYNLSDPPVSFPECDDPNLWSGIDLLLETFWRFFYPIALCESSRGTSLKRDFPESPGQLTRIISKTVFAPYGEIGDMLVETAGYNGEGWAFRGEARGTNRLVSLISIHPNLESFREGEFFDADAQIQAQLEAMSNYQIGVAL
ncbi:hypothetical protein F5B22DRAFT_646802 [Xylaria bambusicola]|uniref:uncharacterized protein n=1 Tax=Xylaria bambusicola TaxID=326684 RepID=UPI0020087C26|nr:uncharacterized protein F5B22DRAFT_646802 [Xylaria bambusicola]KAI0515226.1 hypothetical protein F5B22DRAFT_646802 [Xylaria bambusicola]